MKYKCKCGIQLIVNIQQCYFYTIIICWIEANVKQLVQTTECIQKLLYLHSYSISLLEFHLISDFHEIYLTLFFVDIRRYTMSFIRQNVFFITLNHIMSLYRDQFRDELIDERNFCKSCIYCLLMFIDSITGFFSKFKTNFDYKILQRLPYSCDVKTQNHILIQFHSHLQSYCFYVANKLVIDVALVGVVLFELVVCKLPITR